MIRHLRSILPIVYLLTSLTLLSYVLAQQVLRQTANFPQTAMAEDIAGQLSIGTTPDGVMTMLSVDMAKSLSPFVILYNKEGKEIANSARIAGTTPHLPPGVIDVARNRGQHRVTWEPVMGVRAAVVILPYKSPQGTGFVVVGSSLREVERVSHDLLVVTMVFYAVSLFGLMGISLLAFPKQR